MQIAKQQIVDLLTGRGDHDKADQAQAGLPDQVDTDQHSSKLQELGVDPSNPTGGSDDGTDGNLGL